VPTHDPPDHGSDDVARIAFVERQPICVVNPIAAGELERWIAEHLKSDLRIQALAERVHMSPSPGFIPKCAADLGAGIRVRTRKRQASQ
jgi:hypothetical protein